MFFLTVSTLQRVAMNIPLDRLLLETDAPYFVPRRLPKHSMISMSSPGMALFTAASIAHVKVFYNGLCYCYSSSNLHLCCILTHADFYTSLTQSLHNLGLDPTQFLRILELLLRLFASYDCQGKSVSITDVLKQTKKNTQIMYDLPR